MKCVQTKGNFRGKKKPNPKPQISVGKLWLGGSEGLSNHEHREDKGVQTLGSEQAHSLLAEWPPGRGLSPYPFPWVPSTQGGLTPSTELLRPRDPSPFAAVPT